MSAAGPGFYRAFEDRFRGDGEEIRARLTVYLPFLRAVAQLHPDAGVVDLGCGRGEWLELLRDNEVAAQGVDSDPGMLQACTARGLRAVQGDALEFLRALPDASQAAVTGFHVAEHLPIDVLHALMDEALRVLRPAGLLVLETPNPESLVVSSTDFYLDPTHARPLPPRLLAFMAEYHGFGRSHLLRLQQQAHGSDGPSLWSVLAGVSPDYALVAQKDPGRLASRALEDAFAREHGTSLAGQAARFDRAIADTLRRMEDQMQEIRAVAAQARAAGQLAQQREAELALMRSSRSWRVTRPLRWATELLRRWRAPAGAAANPQDAVRAPGTAGADGHAGAPAPTPVPVDLGPRGREALHVLQSAAERETGSAPDRA